MKPRAAKRLCVFLVSTTAMLLLGFYAGRHDLERAAADTARCISLAHANARIIRADKDVAHVLKKQDNIDEKMQQPSYMEDDFTKASSQVDSTGNTVWLYSLITTDYDGPNLIPHFVQHYTNMGIPLSRFYVDLLHDPALSDTGLLKAQQIFNNGGAHTRTILHPYTPDVAPGGELKHIDNDTDIWTQFPLVCPIVSNIAKGLQAKVTIAKSYLRTGAGHHHIVEPHLAHAYFSDDCTGVACEIVMKRYKQRTLRDLYDLTPYSQYADRYMYSGTGDATGWRAKQWSAWTKVHHFKWHAAVLDNLLFRMSRDSGDCLLDVNEDSCEPVFQFWKEVARQFHSLNATRSIDISAMGCKEGVDTLWSWP